MDKPEFNFRFHNPNSDEDFAKLLIKVCMEACRPRADEAIKSGLSEVAIADSTDKTTDKRRKE